MKDEKIKNSSETVQFLTRLLGGAAVDAHGYLSLGTSIYPVHKPQLMSPRLEEYAHRYRPSFYEVETANGTTMVGMNEYGRIEAASGEDKRIATYGLCGCTGVAVVADHSDGSRTGYIQHFDPLHKDLGRIFMERELGSADIVSHRVVVMTPGEWGQDDRGSYIMAPRDQSMVDELLSGSGLKDDGDVVVYPYSMLQQLGRYGQGTLAITLGDTPTVYTEEIPVRFN